jgi:hypothetical protein
MMTTATPTSSISWHCTAHRSQSGSSFRTRAQICEERSLAAGCRTLGDRLSRRGLWLLQSQALCAEARRGTGLEDFGDPPVEPVLSILVNSLELEADLHPLGRFLMRVHLRELLETRLRLTQAWSGRLKALESSLFNGP